MKTFWSACSMSCMLLLNASKPRNLSTLTVLCCRHDRFTQQNYKSTGAQQISLIVSKMICMPWSSSCIATSFEIYFETLVLHTINDDHKIFVASGNHASVSLFCIFSCDYSVIDLAWWRVLRGLLETSLLLEMSVWKIHSLRVDHSWCGISNRLMSNMSRSTLIHPSYRLNRGLATSWAKNYTSYSCQKMNFVIKIKKTAQREWDSINCCFKKFVHNDRCYILVEIEVILFFKNWGSRFQRCSFILSTF